MDSIVQKPNRIGVIASTVCLAHCLLTPVLFIASVCTDACCEAAPTWWSGLDYLFLAVALFAVYHSAKTSSNKYVAVGLWVSLALLFTVILNESMQIVPLPHYAIYFPTLSLIALHIYNRRFCHLKAGECCANNEECK